MDRKVQLLKPKTLPELEAEVCKAWSEIDMAAVRGSDPGKLASQAAQMIGGKRAYV